MPLSRLSSPFLSGTNRVTLHMLQLLIALVPAVIAIVYFFGSSVLITMALAIVVALLAEALMLALRNRPLKPFLTDGSAIVTAVLLAIALPPLAPWWLTTIGILFAIIFAKHLYGGLGYNPFNPAMVAYVLLLISFPLEMTTWLPVSVLSEHPLDLASVFNIIFSGQLPSGLGIDTISGATPLDAMKTQIGLLQIPSQIIHQPLFGLFGGKG
ncbi:MAG: electron transport complex subunit RsxD, partial [Gammaproteobacteria bacterium]